MSPHAEVHGAVYSVPAGEGGVRWLLMAVPVAWGRVL